MWGLIKANENKENEETENKFSNNYIAKYYSDWMKSNPFDIGTTTI